MEKYKIKVNNKAESKEAQVLLEKLGYKPECFYSNERFPRWVETTDAGEEYWYSTGSPLGTSLNGFKELTLPQLRDLVAHTTGGGVMDIQIRKQLEQLEYIKDKLEYIEYSESLQCYVEKLNGIPTGVAAWVNGAFYGFEQAKAQAIPDGFVVVPKVPTKEIVEAFWNSWLVEQPNAQTMFFAYKAMITAAQETTND